MKKKDFRIIILVFGIVIAVFPTTFIILSNIPVKNGTGSFKISRFGKFIFEVEINNQVAAGDINIIELNKESINLIEVD